MSTDGVIEQFCGCPGTRVVCSIRGAVAGGVQLGVRRWDLQGAVAGAAAAELETWSLLIVVCPTRWKQLSVLGHYRSETQAVFVLLGYSWCRSKTSVARFIPPIHTRFIPRFIPFCCHLQPRASLALGSTCEAMPPKSSDDTKLKEKHCKNQLAALFAEVRQKVATRHTTCERPTPVRDWCGWRA